MTDSLVDAWRRGLAAGYDGWPACDNPFPSGTELARCWQNGWDEGELRRRPNAGQSGGSEPERVPGWGGRWRVRQAARGGPLARLGAAARLGEAILVTTVRPS
jgi:hypothetical protein